MSYSEPEFFHEDPDWKRKLDDMADMIALSEYPPMEVVQQNGYNLRFIENQTPELCMEAVKQNKYALQYVEPKFKHLFSNIELPSLSISVEF